ncbi:MAG: 1-acyl-sn-glycerol-3-phosphate acyltransferase [Myxococcaceae bacterium]|nr:1-acyl-sn-glycerol-3-phosphate acyltransferase [Myxococcaceae bacterium]MCI0671653.1 1-acyl-sn-glycerol-3-phosphate acyltransferase [Myxococcaceae bacterium]
MRRAALGLYTYLEFFLSVFGFLPLMAGATLLHRNDAGRRVRGRWMRRFGRFTSRLTPLWDFSVGGTAPADVMQRAYVVVSNHESVADPFLLSWLPFDMRFIAKEEIFRLPLLGWMMKLGGDIPLKRGDKESVERMREACRATLEAGVPVMMFPEGTRSPDGELLPFRDGAFQLAIEAQVPVLPVAVAGTRQCRPKGSLWFGQARARVRMLEPIPTSGMTLADLPRLREEVRARIDVAVRGLRAELGLSGARQSG